MYSLADIYKLSSWERQEFRLGRGVDQTLTAAEFLELINLAGPYTTATEDLALAGALPPTPKYRLSQILNLSPAELTALANQLRIPAGNQVLLRVLRVLRFSDGLEYDKESVWPATNAKIPLSQIVCASLVSPSGRVGLSQLTQLTNQLACTPLSSQIANNLIRVASSQIFANPIQSFLEPIVNSIDAYAVMNRQPTTGKFGLGFYSLLYWLVRPNRIGTVVLESTYVDFTGQLAAWKGVIGLTRMGSLNPSNHLALSLTEAKAGARPGLTLTLTFFETSSAQATALASQIYDFLQLSLANVTRAAINLTNNHTTTRLGYGTDRVDVKITTSTAQVDFRVQDYATGLDITSLSYLLVPSLSSKGISTQSYQPQVGVQTSIYENSRQAGLLILVGDILVKKLDFGVVATTKMVVQLSSQTQLPVSRDDIIFNPTVKAELELNVFKIVQQALTKPDRYIMLLLKALSKYSTAKYLVAVILDWLTRSGYLLVPYQYYSIYRDVFGSVKLVGVDDTLTVTTEETLIRSKPGRKDLFLAKVVYFVNSDTVSLPTTAGSSRMLFLAKTTDTASASLTATMTADLALIYQDQGLIPLGRQWPSQSGYQAVVRQYLAEFTDPVNPVPPATAIKPIVASIFTKMLGLAVNYNLSQADPTTLIAEFTKTYASWPAQTLSKILGTYLKYLSLLKPQLDYGSAQKTLLYRPGSVLPPTVQDLAKFERYYSQFLQELTPRLAANDTWMLGSQAISFGCFILAPSDSYYGLTETLEEFLYLTLLQNCRSYYNAATTGTVNCQNGAELAVVTNLGLRKASRNYPALFGDFTSQRERTRAAALLKYWRSHLNTVDNREQLYNYLANINLTNFDLAYTLPSLYKASEIYLSVSETSQEFRQTSRTNQTSRTSLAPVVAKFSPSHSYPLSQLIQFVFQHDVRAADFLDFYQKVPNQVGTLPLQILPIAINDGTTKDALTAMIIETAQNSFDAIKATGVMAGTVTINLAQAGNRLSYQIIDPVGIPAAGLLSLSLPFLSTKTAPADLIAKPVDLAGEMGSGFFNVYRAAATGSVDVVNIVTVRDDHYTVITDRPVRSGDPTRVVDVNRVQSSKIISDRPNGTTITVLLTSSQPQEDLTQMLVLCQTWLAAAAAAANIKLVLNGREVRLAARPFYHSDILQASTTISPIESVALTRGSPLSSLVDFLVSQVDSSLESTWDYLRSYIDTNLIVNLIGNYRPTQGRTEILVSDQASLTQELLTVIYYHILNLQLQQPEQSYVANFASRAAVAQVLPWWTSQPIKAEYHSLEQFLWYFRPVGSEWPKGSDLAELVNKLAAGQAINIKKSIDPLMLTVAQAWLDTKDLRVSRAAVVLGDRVGGKLDPQVTNLTTGSQAGPALLNLANKFVQAYWARLPANYQTLTPPVVKLAILDGAIAVYDQNTNQILLSDLSNQTVSKLPETLTYDSLLNYFQTDGAKLFGKRNPAATLIHELEHAWRHSSHSKNGGDSTHSEISLKLPQSQTKVYSFDEAANVMYDYVLKAGLMTALVET